MRRGIQYGIGGAALLLSLVLIAGGVVLVKAMPIGTGYVAKYICSSTFISQRDPKDVFKEDVAPVNPLARLVAFDIDRGQRSVRATSFGLFSRTAIYREGCGCALVIGTTEAQMRAQKLVPPDFSRTRPSPGQNLPWPEGTAGPVDPVSLGVDATRLEQALTAAFAETGTERKRKTRAVLVVYRGRLIGERYAPGFHKDMPLLGWSMSKSVTNALVGILVGEGKLDIKQPAPVPEWRQPGDARQAITLDQLLRMSSGLSFEEVYAPFFDATQMLYGSPDFAVFAAGKLFEAKPEARWKYSSGTANIVARVIRQTVARDYPYYYTAFYEKLFDRIGMTSAVLEPDASGTFVGSSYAFATPRDWARFGLLYLHDGVWQGRRILPAGWVDYTKTPTPAAPEGAYGALFWLNAGAADHPGHRRWPDVPKDAYAAEGFQEQKVIVIPSKDLVMVRFGATSDRKAWNTNRFILDVLSALP
ncbi:MAG: class C beta-lactamase-related serine hydrolase [Desulfobacteraceae bacterium]|nr:MAG: class C beta-lactamase-related serine hydrolase [Desulfobacteraceae bacterium]